MYLLINKSSSNEFERVKSKNKIVRFQKGNKHIGKSIYIEK